MAYEDQQAQIDRLNMLANALRQNGVVTPQRQTQVASGGLAVPISPFESALRIAQGGFGAYMGSKAQDAETALGKQKDTDAQGQLSGIMDQLAGPSRMANPADPTQPPVGATSNFQDASGGAPQPQQPTVPGAVPVEQNARRSAIANILKGADAQQSVSLLRGPALATLEPKPDYTLAEGAQRRSGANNALVAQAPPKEKEFGPDHALVKIIDPSKKEGYSTIKRSDFDPTKMNEYTAPTSAQLAMASWTPEAMQTAVEYGAVHDSKPPPNMPRNGPIYGEYLTALGKHYKETGNDVGSAQVLSEQNHSDQASLTNITKLRDNTNQAYGTLDANLASLQKAYDAAGNSGTEWGNKLYRMWQTGTGDPTLKPVRAYLAAAQKEYAKLQMNSFGNAMTSDAANADAAKVINENFTSGGMPAVIAAMRGEGQNRVGALETTYQGINERMKARSHPTGSAGGPKKGAVTSPVTGPKVFATEAEAEAAFNSGKIAKGDSITVGGVTGKWQ